MALQPVDRDTLRSRLDLLEVAGSYMRLQKAGTEWRGLCPFHDERTPSFYVNPGKGLWICRGQCGVGGDVFDFVMRVEKLDFRQAAELLANRIGCTLIASPGDARRSDERDRLYEVCGLATRLFETALWRPSVGDRAREYLLRRGLTEETIRAFRLGWAPASWDALARHLERAKVSLADAEAAGLIRARDNGRGYYDRFRGRIMFPILDGQDRTLGFGGRVLNAEEEPKYLNTAETPIFAKSTVLYGLPFAVGELTDGAIIVEGYMDVIGLHQAGVRAAVATLGTALTSGHLRLLRRHTERVILCYDADAAGQRATERAAVLFIDEGVEGRVLTLPAGQDPDEYIAAEGRAAWDALVAAAPDLITHRVQTALDQAGDDALARAAAVQESVVPILADLRDPLRQAMVLGQLTEWWSSQTSGLSEEFERSLAQAVRDYRRRATRRRQGDDPGRAAPPPSRLTRETRLEHLVLADLLAHPSLLARAREDLGPGMFAAGPSRELFEQLLAGGEAGINHLPSLLSDAAKGLLADLSCRAPREAQEAAAGFARQVIELRANALAARVAELRRQRAELDPEDTEAQEANLRNVFALEQELAAVRRELTRST